MSLRSAVESFQQCLWVIWKKILLGVAKISYFPPVFFLYNKNQYLYQFNGNQFHQLLSVIKESDILGRRTETNLDTRFISGYWNHFAIYIGNMMVLHLTDKGVVKESLFDFCHTDHIICLRSKTPLSSEELNQKMSEVLGKEYDYSFNSNNINRFYCTELIQYMFKDIGVIFEKTSTFGKMTITPDSVAESPYFVEVFDSRKCR